MEASNPRRMVIRRTSPLGERRRRVVVGDVETQSTATPVRSNRTNPPRRYSSDALRDAQPRIHDCIPLRRWLLLVWFLLGTSWAIAHAGLEYACDYVVRWSVAIDTSPLRLGAHANLASSTQTLTFLLCTVYCLLILQFRRHRVDDYRGRYRIWYWAAAITAFLTLDASSHLSSLGWQATLALFRQPPLHHSTWTTVFLCLVVLVPVVRLTIEMRDCPTAWISFWASYGVFCVSQVTPDWAFSPTTSQTLTHTLQLVSSQWLLFSLVALGRHVFLDAQGERLTIRKARRVKPKSKQTISKETNEQNPAVEECENVATGTPSVPRSSPLSRPPEKFERDDEEASPTLSVSGTDRKRLRKEQQKQRRAA